jgi:hypothetical protein
MPTRMTKLRGVTGERPASSTSIMEMPEMRQLLDGLVAALTDPRRRKAAVEVAQQQCLPMVQTQVINRLVEIVKLGCAAHGDAVDSLIQFGPPALRVLMRNINRGADTTVQLRLLEALSVFAAHPSFKGHVDHTLVLANMGLRVADPDPQNAFANLLTVLRRNSATQ